MVVNLANLQLNGDRKALEMISPSGRERRQMPMAGYAADTEESLAHPLFRRRRPGNQSALQVADSLAANLTNRNMPSPNGP